MPPDGTYVQVMSYAVRLVADSISPDGVRISTFEACYPRIVHSELMTHGMLTKNAASSRAIPINKMIAAVLASERTPQWWGAAQKGMQASVEVPADIKEQAQLIWDQARANAAASARQLGSLGLHKQIPNRLLEPFQWMTTLITGTDWSNFFALRAHADAQPEFQVFAAAMRDLHETSTPVALGYGQWHMPLTFPEEIADGPLIDWRRVSAGRAGRVSYKTHNGVRDPQADLGLFNSLTSSGHMSPLGHVARPFSAEEWNARRELQNLAHVIDGFDERHRAVVERQLEYAGNLRGWWPLRKDIPNEHDFSLVAKQA